MTTELDQWLAESYDPFDPWGSTLLAQFSVASALVAVGEPLPAEWQARNIYPPTVEDDPAGVHLVDLIESGTVSLSDVVAFGHRLSAECDLMRSQGLDY